jgi:HEAT repeat protein
VSRKRSTPPKLPVKLPSVRDSDSEPTNYDEPDLPRPADRVPRGRFELQAPRSRAELRMRVEQLLLRKEASSAEAWAELGEEARALLVTLLDDEAIRSHDALRHRVIAVLGELGVQRSVPQLAQILADRGERPVTKAYVAGSLGRIGGPAATGALAPAVSDKDDMVRRQAAIALGRIDRPDVIPHLIVLQGDASPAVSEVAADTLRAWEKKLDKRLVPRRRTPTAKKRGKKSTPAPEQ